MVLYWCYIAKAKVIFFIRLMTVPAITTSVSQPMTSPPSWRLTLETWVDRDVAAGALVEAVGVVEVAEDGQVEVAADLRR